MILVAVPHHAFGGESEDAADEHRAKEELERLLLGPLHYGLPLLLSLSLWPTTSRSEASRSPSSVGRITVSTGTGLGVRMFSYAVRVSTCRARNIATPAARTSTAAANSAGRAHRSSSAHQPRSTSAMRARIRASRSFQYCSPTGAAYIARKL